MTLRLAVLMALAGATAVAVVRLRTEKRRCRWNTTRLEIRKIELETERWRLARRVAQATNSEQLKRRAAEQGIRIEPEPPEATVRPNRPAARGR
jgi:hypothetical protein